MRSGYIPAFDGLRAIAALIVVLFHLLETFSKGPATQAINHGYLAVDFFYLLSGYILCHAYDNRWDSMSIAAFIRRRIRRLHPMVIAGSVIGVALLAFESCNAFPLLDSASWWKILMVFVLGCLLLPTPQALDIRGWDEMFSLNSPQWTLFYEYIANICYATFLRKAGKKTLAFLAFITALLVADLTLNLNLLSVYGERGEKAYTVIGGWTSTLPDAYIAMVRLSYPFLAGMLLKRLNFRVRIPGGSYLAAILLGTVLCMPRLLPETPLINGVYELVCILLVLPMILLLAQGGSIPSWLNKLCKDAGELSFPLYLIHFPFVYVQVSLFSRYPQHGFAISAICFVLILVTAWGMRELMSAFSRNCAI